MPADPEVVVRPDADDLAGYVAAHVIERLNDILAGRERAALALTAGSIMERTWRALAASPDAASVDWSRVDVFWGDERFVPHDSPDRNDAPASKIMFDSKPFSEATLYSMPTSDGRYGDDLDVAAAGYAEQLAAAGYPNASADLVLLGVGPDGHCCSLFPDHPSSRDLSAPVIAVRDSPKPPPLRLSLSFDALTSADEIWAVVSGPDKADAVARALGGSPREHVPSAGARGRSKTLWLLDEASASKL